MRIDSCRNCGENTSNKYIVKNQYIHATINLQQNWFIPIRVGFVLYYYCINVRDFAVVPMMMMGGGPFNQWDNRDIPDDIKEEIKNKVLSSKSVLVFKETFPEYREEFNFDYNGHYSVQSRNEKHGKYFGIICKL